MLRRLIKTTFAGSGRATDVWPVVLLLSAALVPTVCVLWFMSAAMRNERFAVRQKLADVYRGQLSASQARLQKYWKETAAELERWATTTSAPTAFAECVRSGLVDSVVIFDEQGRVNYPNAPSASQTDFGEADPKWQEASHLEHLRKYVEAAKQYDALARATTNANAAARAFQAEARCLLQARQNDAVLQVVNEIFSSERYRHAADRQGRLIAANVELMALEFMTNRNAPVFQSTARRLAARLRDYENPVLAAPQRRFLMKAMQRLSPGEIEFPTLAAEEMAAEVSERQPNQTREFALKRGAVSGLWQFTTPNGRVLALIRSDKLLATTKVVMARDNPLTDVEVTLVPPDADAPDTFVTLSAGEQMPGWRLVLSLKDRKFFDTMAGRQTANYLWAGLLVVAMMGVLTLITLRLVRRQMTLARLKNDLAATVSHELKTPLSSIRVLVESLLDSDQLDEQKTREYLQLIAQANERLARLIQNFLTFSRMERKKYALHFSPLPARQVIDAAVESTRGRFEVPGCRLDVQIEDNLPPVMADPDALGAALINLLENAYKYSDEIKQIDIRVRAENGSVLFSVKDNGIGIAPRERKKIFQPFYQVDQHLSRKGGGCGLGLSIVRFITTAHHGSVSVESRPGCGSTFTIALPFAPDARPIREEALA